MSGRHIVGALFIDMGQANREGHYVKPPRARYECTLRRHTEGPVTGPTAVARFVAEARAIHTTRCTTSPTGATT